MQAVIVGLTVLTLWSDFAGAEEDRQTVVVAVGAAGSDEYAAQFNEWAVRIAAAASRADAEFISISSESTDSETPRESLTRNLRRAARRQTTEPLWVILIGHGTFNGRTAYFNLDGPDIAAHEFTELIGDAERPIAVVCCHSCSGPWVSEVSGPNRVIVTATRNGSEFQFSRFGDGLTKALSSTDADIDRDGQTSLLEAWLFASRRTAEFYQSDGRLATEHALLDDNADGQGTRAEVYDGHRPKSVQSDKPVDGLKAKRYCLIRSDAERLLSPEQRHRRDQLEAQLDSLRTQRNNMKESAYLDSIEPLLLKLAALYDAAESLPTDESPPGE